MQDLNYHHLYYFWCVAREGHLTRTAEQLSVSQSALSAQIKQLEASLGHSLFYRERKKLLLTEAGHMVLGYANIIFTTGSELIQAVASGEGLQRQILKIGSVATLSRNFQEGFLHSLLEEQEVEFVLESGSLEELLERLGSHRLHLILSNRPVSAAPGQPWRCRRIARQQACLIGPPRKKKEAFRFPEEIEEVDLILPGLSSDMRNAFDLFLEKKGLHGRVFAQIDDMALLRLITRNSGAVALAPAVVVQDELENGELELYCHVPGVYENFFAITMQRHFEPDIFKKLLGK